MTKAKKANAVVTLNPIGEAIKTAIVSSRSNNKALATAVLAAVQMGKDFLPTIITVAYLKKEATDGYNFEDKGVRGDWLDMVATHNYPRVADLKEAVESASKEQKASSEYKGKKADLLAAETMMRRIIQGFGAAYTCGKEGAKLESIKKRQDGQLQLSFVGQDDQIMSATQLAGKAPNSARDASERTALSNAKLPDLMAETSARLSGKSVKQLSREAQAEAVLLWQVLTCAMFGDADGAIDMPTLEDAYYRDDDKEVQPSETKAVATA